MGVYDYQSIYRKIDLLYKYSKNEYNIIECGEPSIVCFFDSNDRLYNVHLYSVCYESENDIEFKKQVAIKFPDSADAQKLKEVESHFEIKAFPQNSSLLSLYSWLYAFSSKDESIEFMKKIKGYCDQKYGENVISVDIPEKSKKHCYVATAVYGSYDCPQVWRFRRYRDEALSKNIFGRLFIKIYYAVSPTVIKYFGKTKWFNSFFRKHLDKFYLKLAEKGYDDTPYQDI